MSTVVEIKKNCEAIHVIVAAGRQFFKGNDEDSTFIRKISASRRWWETGME